MARRHELTDPARAEIQPLLPRSAARRPVADQRRMANGILWKLTTGAPWRNLPERYGPWQTCYKRSARW